MSKSNDRHIKVLNGLIETTLDSAHGYKEAAQAATAPRFKALFERRSMERRQLTADLQAEVRGLGGAPEDDGTMLAAAHRVFLDLKHRVIGSDLTLINEVKAGEKHIKTRFEQALRNDDLSSPVKTAVAKVYDAIKAGHDEMRELKRELKVQPVS